MTFAIDAEHSPVGVDHGQRVEIGVVAALEEADRQDHAQLGRQPAHPCQQRAALEGLGQLEVPLGPVLAEIGPLEQLLKEHDVGPSTCRLAHQGFGARHVPVAIPLAAHLRRGDGDLPHDIPLPLRMGSIRREPPMTQGGDRHICSLAESPGLLQPRSRQETGARF